MLRTRLTERLSLRYPILNAAMGGTAGGALAAAVSAAGGLGLIGGGVSSRDYLEREFTAAGNQRVGCGFITWELAEKPENLDIAIARAPVAILLSFGDPAPYLPKIRAAGLPVICQVQTVAMAREVLRLGADIVVAQGTEAGGHGGNRATLPLVPAVVDVARSINPAAIVVGAGGIADGRGLAALLMLGAEGALIGTLFHASEESLVSAEAKARIVAGSGDDTIRTRTFDIARDVPWPPEFTLRALAKDFGRKWQGRDDDLARDTAAKELCLKAYERSDLTIRPVLASEGTDQINAIEPAGAIVAWIAAEAEAALTRRFD
jgi:nitronate monooxygenase